MPMVDQVPALQEPVAVLGASFATGSASFVDVTGISLPATTGAVYWIEVWIPFQTAATTTGGAFGLTFPTGAALSQVYREMISTTAAAVIVQSANGNDGTSTNSTGVAAANTTYFARLSALLQTSIFSGNVQLRAKTEVAASNITLLPGTTLKMRRVA